ncbi:ACP S-malonyltransferase [Candidatus Sumerlaeota bacterium]|nr:ACP S-malonyltransferase [Candidatus Sumerlaeota bacterium]
MSNLAFVFPGQGSQRVGMGQDWRDKTAIGRQRFEEADAVLGRPISQICFEGSENELKDTHNTQPALFIHSAIVFDALQAKGITPRVVAGHSLGEYSALYAAGVFDFATGLRLVQTRAELMAACAVQHPGAMAAVLGLDEKPLQIICEAADGVCGIANYNSPGQLVISGEEAAVKQVCDQAREAGAKRALILPVSGAFHSPLMQSAADKMRAALDRANLQPPNCSFINNADAQAMIGVEAIKDSLARQITSPVRWIAAMKMILDAKPDAVIEAGAGKVLCGLFKRMENAPSLINCDRVENIDFELG